MTVPDLSLTTLLVIGSVTTFVAIVLLVASVSTSILERRAVYRSLRSVRDIDLGSTGELRRQHLSVPVASRLLVPLMRRLTRLGRRLTPVSVIERLEQELQYAGSPPKWDAGRVLAMKVLLPPVFIAAVVVGGPTLLGIGLLQLLVAAALLAFVGWYLPEWIVRSKAAKRQAQIQRELPDALDLLSITVEAGLGFDSALSRVSREVKGPLGQELYRVVQEIQLGEDRADALRSLGERNDLDELRSFVLAMIQADILGIAVSNVLQVQARELRLKRRQRAEERAQKLPVKIVFPLILCIFPALFVVLLGPAVIQIWETIFQVF